jgi:hypothetical protein
VTGPQRSCRKCGGRLVIPSTGRPPTYCSIACRRSAEFEIRRISRRLEGLENERHKLQTGLAVVLSRGEPDAWERDLREARTKLRVTNNEINGCERRLLALLSDDLEAHPA